MFSPSTGASAALITNLSGGASVNMCPVCNIVTMLARCANCGNMTVSIRAAPDVRPTTVHRVPPPPPPSLSQPQQYYNSPGPSHSRNPQQGYQNPQSQAQQLRGEIEEYIHNRSSSQQQHQNHQDPHHNNYYNNNEQQQQPPSFNNNNNLAATPHSQHTHHHHGTFNPSTNQRHAPPTPSANVNNSYNNNAAFTSTSRASSPVVGGGAQNLMRGDLDTFPQRLENELSRMKAKEEELEHQLSSANQHKAQSEMRLTETSFQLQDLQRTNLNIQAEISNLKSDLSLAREETRYAKEEQTRTQKRLEQDQEKVRAKTEEVMKLQAEIADWKGQTDLASIEHKATQDEATQLRQRLNDEAKRADTLRGKMQEEIDRLRRELSTAEVRQEQRLNDLAKKQHEEANERSELLSRLRKFEADTNLIRTEFEQEIFQEKQKSEKLKVQMKEEMKRIEEDSDTIRHRNAALDEQLQSTRRECATNEEALRDVRRKLSEMTNEHITLRAEFDTKLAETLAIQADQLNKERRDLKHMVDDARGREEIAVTRLTDLEKELSGARDALAKTATFEKELKSKLDSEVEKTKHEAELHQEAKTHAQKMQDMLNEELARQRQRANDAEDSFSAYKRQAEEKIAILTRDLERFTKENTELKKFTVSRELEAELRAKLAQTETERSEAAAKRDEAISVVDALKKDRTDARKLAEEHEVESERAKAVLRQVAAHFGIPGAAAMSVESAVKSLVPKSEEVARHSNAAIENEDRLTKLVGEQKQELNQLSDELHRARCDVEAERRYLGDTQDRCDQSVAAAEQRALTWKKQVESERAIARDDIDTMIRSHDTQLAALQAEKQRIAEELKNAYLEIEQEKHAIAQLVKEKHVFNQDHDSLQSEIVPLRRERQELLKQLETAKEDLRITREMATKLEEDKVQLAKQAINLEQNQGENKVREKHLHSRYEQEMEALRKALRQERAKVLREIDMTHAAHGRALMAQEQLDHVVSENEVVSARRRAYYGTNGTLLLSSPDKQQYSTEENNDENSFYGNNRVSSSSTTALRGQGLSSSPSSNWNKTTILPDSSFNMKMQSPAATPQQHPARSQTSQNNNNNTSFRRGDQLVEEAAQWRETRIQQQQPHILVRGSEHGYDHVPPNMNNLNNNQQQFRGRSGSGGSQQAGISRSVPLSQFRRQ